ncbi:MAG TPA: UbiD family decarboxylase [Devosia sp.]|nr:UbiD family decarboxylase [Devosia sp.]
MPAHTFPKRTFPPAADLRSFMAELEQRGRLHRITRPISLVHEMTEIHRRVLLERGPALLFEHPVHADGRRSDIPVLVNLFGTVERVAWGMGIEPEAIPALGEALAWMRNPTPPGGWGDAMAHLPIMRAAAAMGTTRAHRASVQQVCLTKTDINLGDLPIQWCWPGEPAPLITWGLVTTAAPDDPNDINIGVYRLQVFGRTRLIARWLAQRGGARHHRLWQQAGRDMPVAIVIGADPATILSTVMPLPEAISELSFAGVLRRRRTETAPAHTVPLPVPARAEIVIEGYASATETADEGPYGDHTGYYNAVEPFPVIDVTAITRRRDPVYLSTFTGRPPDEPSRLGEAFMPLLIPTARQQFPEIVDLWLPPEACSYRAMVVSIDKRYPGQARRVMMGLWSLLPQFTYTKLIIAVDGDIDVRRWDDVIWALSTRFDAGRDLVVIENTPIDYLDFASPQSGLGSKLGLDATRKLPPETQREWGRTLAMSEEIIKRVDTIWDGLGLGARP